MWAAPAVAGPAVTPAAPAAPIPAAPAPPVPTPAAPTDPAPATAVLPTGTDLDQTRFAPATRVAGTPVVAQPIAPGTPVPHAFDVVTVDLGMETPPPPPPTQADIVTLLTESQEWWSAQTGLGFDFTSAVSYASVPTTCDTMLDDAMAAFGVAPGDNAAYTDHGRDLLILITNGACDEFAGTAWTVTPVGNVFAGGVFSVVLEPPGRLPYTDTVNAVTLSHEFGHTIGLVHSNLTDCGTAAWPGDDSLGPVWDGEYAGLPTCAGWEYGDTSTIMGSIWSHDDVGLDGLQRWYLGVGHDQVTLVDAPGSTTYTLAPMGTAGPGQTGALVIPLTTNPATRGTAIAWSVELHSSRDGVPGVYIVDAEYGDARGPGLITSLLQPIGSAPQPEPNVQRPFVTPLGVGSTYVSADGSVRVTVLSVGTTAQVAVTRTTQPGLPGDVSITSTGGTLAADAFSVGPTSGIAYQWYRNGTAIPGATSRTYTPALPDPNAVFRVEATFSAPGYAATTHSSRGIVPDDARFTLAPPATPPGASTATLVFLDANGRPQPCDGTPMDFAFATPSGAPVITTRTTMAGTSRPGVCTAAAGIPLGGSYVVTAHVPTMTPGEPTDPPTTGALPLDALRLAPYWTPHSAPWSAGGTGPSAALLLGSAEPTYTNADSSGAQAAFSANTGGTPPYVTVAVTDATGQPAAGVPVTFHAGDGLVLSAATGVTDADGQVQVRLSWDPAVAPGPAGDGTIAALWRDVSATVAGFAEVRGSPQAVRIFRTAVGQITGWFEGGVTTAPADGVSAVTLHFRAFDRYGTPLTGPATPVDAWWRGRGYVTVNAPTLDGPAWDDASQSYVVRVTATRPTTGGVVVSAGVLARFGGFANAPPVVFTLVGPTTLALGTPAPIAASEDACAPGAAVAVAVRATAVVGDAAGTAGASVPLTGGVVFTVPSGSPLHLTTAGTVERPNSPYGYQVTVEAGAPGTYPLTVTAADGSLSATTTVSVAECTPAPPVVPAGGTASPSVPWLALLFLVGGTGLAAAHARGGWEKLPQTVIPAKAGIPGSRL